MRTKDFLSEVSLDTFSKLNGNIDLTFSNIVSAQGTLNSTTIGLTTAASAAFTGATVTNDPSSADDVTKKQYVDNTATLLAIALGV